MHHPWLSAMRLPPSHHHHFPSTTSSLIKNCMRPPKPPTPRFHRSNGRTANLSVKTTTLKRWGINQKDLWLLMMQMIVDDKWWRMMNGDHDNSGPWWFTWPMFDGSWWTRITGWSWLTRNKDNENNNQDNFNNVNDNKIKTETLRNHNNDNDYKK